MNTASTLVRRGARWLDRKQPGWWKKINPRKLDLANSCNCVLGQLEGEFDEGLVKLQVPNDGRGLGFERPTFEGPTYDELTQEWLREIAARAI